MAEYSFEEYKLYKNLGFSITDVMAENESAEYCAFQFTADNRKMLFRKSKITPTKNGQFVTLWKREEDGGLIAPFSEKDDIAAVIVSAENESYKGHFIFPSSILCNKNIFTTKAKEGKRAFRVYPPWDVPQSKQAAITQKWQLDYFTAIESNFFSDVERVLKLFCMQ